MNYWHYDEVKKGVISTKSENGFKYTYVNGENDTMLKAYTEDFGVIYVLAKSLRKRDGKLKAHVRKYRYTTITIVKGKERYRLTGASEIYIHHDLLMESAQLIEKYHQGEQKSNSLFNKIYNLMSLYQEQSRVIDVNTSFTNTVDTNNYRRALYFILLVDLGYIDAVSIGVSDIEEYRKLDTHDILLRVSLYKTEINSQIRRALRESML